MHLRPHHALLSTLVLALGAACGSSGTPTDDGEGGGGTGGGTGGGDATPVRVDLAGAVEKGPFVLGTSVSVSPVNPDGSPTGEVFNTSTVNDLGEFNVSFEAAGHVSLEGTGFYFNEVSGELSTASLTLRAFHDITAGGPQSAYLNVMTHLGYERVVALAQGGASFDDAIATSEREVRVGLGVGPAGFDPGAPGTQLDILGGDTDGNAYLLAISAVLAKAGELRAGGPEGPVDASLQELLNGFALGIRDDGTVDPTIATALREAEQALDPDDVMDNLAARLKALGSAAEVPDIHRFIDTDLDEVMNAADNCRLRENTDQDDADDDGLGDACDCGSGTVDAGEQCDDGNTDDGDDCLSDCTLPACGDGVVQEGVEECDDANEVDTDDCIACVLPTCGDSVIQEGVEACDAGSANHDDYECTSTCAINVCGDGLVDVNAERCDDGNGVDGDTCNGDCQSLGEWTVELASSATNGSETTDLDVSSDGGIVVLTHYVDDGFTLPRVSRFDGDGTLDWAWPDDPQPTNQSGGIVALDGGDAAVVHENSLGAVLIHIGPTGEQDWSVALEGVRGTSVDVAADGKLVVAGLDVGEATLHLKAFTIGETAPSWERSFDVEAGILYGTRIEVAPNGDLVVGTSALEDDPESALRVGRYTSAGEEIWVSSEAFGANKVLNDVAVTSTRVLVGGGGADSIAWSLTASGATDRVWEENMSHVTGVDWLDDGRPLAAGILQGNLTLWAYPASGSGEPATSRYQYVNGAKVRVRADGSLALAWDEADVFGDGFPIARLSLVSAVD